MVRTTIEVVGINCHRAHLYVSPLSWSLADVCDTNPASYGGVYLFVYHVCCVGMYLNLSHREEGRFYIFTKFAINFSMFLAL